ncbi:hypothetical protein M011DRAFT_169591 [Sporormia fimetaria CBS 119925]|uniref:Uncharacterized protein n=1 Tax=Sporormia fimetaria CBS 119925 TaxID=1340428 RepID=A0A6A6V4Z0_9PLEO|nr:hypothetical protein M011DRAFT_169591 [Sporormia fimetaria CBS 119925]
MGMDKLLAERCRKRTRHKLRMQSTGRDSRSGFRYMESGVRGSSPWRGSGRTCAHGCILASCCVRSRVEARGQNEDAGEACGGMIGRNRTSQGERKGRCVGGFTRQVPRLPGFNAYSQ